MADSEDRPLKLIEYSTKAILEKQDQQIKLINEHGTKLIDAQNLQLKYLRKINSNASVIAVLMLISFLVGCLSVSSALGLLNIPVGRV